MASRHPSPSRTASRRSCGERLQSERLGDQGGTGAAAGELVPPPVPGRVADGFLLFRRSCHPRRFPRQPAASLVPDHLVAHLVVAELAWCMFITNASPARDSLTAGAARVPCPSRQSAGGSPGSASSANSRSADASTRRETDTNPSAIVMPCRPQYPCACRRCGQRAIIGHRCPRCCGGVRAAVKTMASGDLGGPRPGGMTVPERPGWHLPGPCCRTSRVPEDGRRRIRPAVIRCGRLPVTGPERGEARRQGEILFFDGPADAAQMPPEGV